MLLSLISINWSEKILVFSSLSHKLFHEYVGKLYLENELILNGIILECIKLANHSGSKSGLISPNKLIERISSLFLYKKWLLFLVKLKIYIFKYCEKLSSLNLFEKY